MQEKKSYVNDSTFPNSPIFKGKVLVKVLCLAKHILELGPGNVQNVFGNIWTSLELVGSS